MGPIPGAAGAEPGTPLTVVPVGVGAAYGRPEEAQSAYLVTAGPRSLCLDLGAGTLNLLRGLTRPEDLDALVITHLHPDHCADVLALRVYMLWGPGAGRRLRVLAPDGLRARLAAFAGDVGWDEAFAFEELAPGGGEVDLGGLRLRHREVPHLPPTHAVRIDHGGRSITYGADCAPNAALPELAAGTDLLLTECSFGASPGPEAAMHLDAASAGSIARAAGAGRLLLTHCYPEHDRDAAARAAREAFGGPVDWARQGEAVTA